MTIENVRLEESIIVDADDPRLAEAELNPFLQDKHGNWYDRHTGEAVTFANVYEERKYKRGMTKETGHEK